MQPSCKRKNSIILSVICKHSQHNPRRKFRIIKGTVMPDARQLPEQMPPEGFEFMCA